MVIFRSLATDYKKTIPSKRTAPTVRKEIMMMLSYLMYLHSAELNVVAVTENVNTFLLV